MSIGSFEPSNEYTPPAGDILPKGVYNGVSTRVAKKEISSAGRPPRTIIEIEHDIVAPADYANRKAWDTFWIDQDDMTKAETEKKRFQQYIFAAGVTQAITEETLYLLEGKETRFELTATPERTTKEGKTYKAKNWFRKYYPAGTPDSEIGGAKNAAPATAAAPKAWGGAPAAPRPAATAAAPAKPWGAR